VEKRRIQADVSNFDSAAAFCKSGREYLTDVDLLVNNAGITRDRSLFIMQPSDWDAVINTNLTGISM
jgi:NADP-dependent 3-hydroxy acid dehydrogenase YdfG